MTGAQAQHYARVLRGVPGMRCEVVSGGRVWAATVASVSEERVEFLLEHELAAQGALPVTLLLAVFKFDRMEWAIEKATELGVARIVPVVARRTEKHLGQAAVARVERWRRIANEATQQSRRAEVPVIADPVLLKQALLQEWHGARLQLAEKEHMVMLTDALAGNDAVTLAVGPEGGWTPEEEQQFQAAQWQPVSLGSRILRAETAAIAATAIAGATLAL